MIGLCISNTLMEFKKNKIVLYRCPAVYAISHIQAALISLCSDLSYPLITLFAMVIWFFCAVSVLDRFIYQTGNDK